MNSTFLSQLIPPPDRLADLDLDDLRKQLEVAAHCWAELEHRTRLYETEFQREVRAKIDLCGPISGCATPEAAFTLTGLTLLEIRQEISRKFNQTYCIAPLSRHAQTPNQTALVPDSDRCAPSSANRTFGPSYRTGACG